MKRLANFVLNAIGAFRTLRSTHKARRRRSDICLLAFCMASISMPAQMISAPSPQVATITGTVEDLNDGLIPGATVAIQEMSPDSGRRVTSDGAGFFFLGDVPSAVAVHLVVHADEFQDWTSAPITLTPGQMLELAEIKLTLSAVETTVNAIMPEVLEKEQVKAEEKQRILGIIPNFYVVYEKNPMPLTAEPKFELALKAGTDPVTIGSEAFLAGIYQAAATPAYQ